MGAEQWLACPGGLTEIGHRADSIHFDKELPRHRVWLEPFELNRSLVSNAAYAAFIADGGYRHPELWMSEGWALVQQHQWQAPRYWRENDDEFTLAGRRRPRDPGRLADRTPLDRSAPADHSESAFGAKLSPHTYPKTELRSSGGMKSDERRQAIKRQREQLIQDLETVYMAAFDRLGELEGEVGEVKAAQLTQMILNSKTAAIEPLEKEIEKPVLTTPGEA